MTELQGAKPVGILRTPGNPPQVEFWRSEAKYRLFCGGVGSGKTYAGVLEILRMPAGSTGMVVAPTYGMLQIGALAKFMELCEPFIASHNKALLCTRLINGTTIYWRTADRPSALRGASLGWFYIDEGAYCTEDTWQVLIGRLRKLPGRGWITTTPKGFDYLYKLFGSGDNPKFHLIHSPTSANRFLPADYVDDLRSQYTSAYAEQELEGRFIDLSSARIQRSWFKYGEPPRKLPVSLGVDLAITEATAKKRDPDYTAIVASCIEPDSGMRYILDVVRDRKTFNGVMNFIQQQAAKWQDWPLQVINVESNQYQVAVVQELRRTTSLNVQPVHSSKDLIQRIAPVEARLEHGLVTFADGLPPYFEDELLGHPKAPHDDCVSALQLSLNISTRRQIRVY